MVAQTLPDDGAVKRNPIALLRLKKARMQELAWGKVHVADELILFYDPEDASKRSEEWERIKQISGVTIINDSTPENGIVVKLADVAAFVEKMGADFPDWSVNPVFRHGVPATRKNTWRWVGGAPDESDGDGTHLITSQPSTDPVEVYYGRPQIETAPVGDKELPIRREIETHGTQAPGGFGGNRK